MCGWIDWKRVYGREVAGIEGERGKTVICFARDRAPLTIKLCLYMCR